MPHLCVLGAGIIGLSTAVAIQEQYPDCKITICAAEVSPNLTSDVAAGFIEPHLCDDVAILKWCDETMAYIRSNMKKNIKTGAEEMSGLLFHSTERPPPNFAYLMANFKKLTESELQRYHPDKQAAGYFYTTLYLQPTEHLAYLKEKFLSNGGQIVLKSIEKLEELGNQWDAIINCTGLGAKKLLNDVLLKPVRGQILRVRAPAVKHFFVDDDTYVLLNDDCCIVGGTADVDQWDTTVNEELASRLLNEAKRKVHGLHNAEILSHHVGLRPYRDLVRLEAEKVKISGTEVPVIHNYGHGGSGISVFWGCALEVLKLLDPILQPTPQSHL